MAITRTQKLINLHTSAMTEAKQAELVSALEFGEIAVEHGPGVAIYTKATSGSTDYLAKFIDEVAVKALIGSEGVDALKARVQALENTHVSGETGMKSVATEVADGINALNASVESTAPETGKGLQVKVDEAAGKITAVTVSGNFDQAYDELGAAASAKAEIIGSATTAGDTLKKLEDRIVTNETAIETLNGNDTTEGSVAKKVKDAVEALDATVTSLTNGLSVKIVETNGKLASVEAEIAAETYDDYGAAATAKADVIGTSADSKDKLTIYGAEAYAKDYADTLNSAMDSRVDEVELKLTGFSDGQNVKEYVDNKVVGLLHFKGSKDTIDDLPDITSSDVTHGDVWNIVSGFTYEEKYYPAGTNVVAIKMSGETVLDTPYWDALGGTVDLTPYAKTEYVNGKITEVKAIIGSYTTASTVQSAIEAVQSRATKLEDLHKASGESKYTVAQEIDEKIADLDAEKSQAAGDDGLALAISEVDGKITSISGSIAANTYDKYGDADAALTSAKSYTDSVNQLMDARVDALELKHVSGKTVADEVSDGIDAIAEVSKAGESHDVKVTAVTKSGSISSVIVEAPDFANLYDEKNAAASAETNAKAYADGLNTAMNTRVVNLEATHATAETGYKTVKDEAETAIAAIAEHTENATASCGATASVTTAAGSVSAVSIDMTALVVDCGEF